MAEKTMDTRLKIRGDTASNWSSVNPTLLKNEIGYDETNKKFKIGDGTTPWNSLKYIKSSSQPVIELNGTLGDDFSVSINFNQPDWEQFVNNKYASVVLYNPDWGSQSYILKHETLIDNEDGSWYASYRYEYEVNKNYILTIYWSEDDMYIDEFYEESCNNGSGGSVNLEPITLNGSIENIDNIDEFYINVEFDGSEYNKFLQNKNAPININGTVGQLLYFSEYENNEYYATYYFIRDNYKYCISIYWSSEDTYIDESYAEDLNVSRISRHTDYEEEIIGTELYITLTEGGGYVDIDLFWVGTGTSYTSADYARVTTIVIRESIGWNPDVKIHLHYESREQRNWLKNVSEIRIENTNRMIFVGNIFDNSVEISEMGNYTDDTSYVKFISSTQNPILNNVFYIYYDERGLCHISTGLKGYEL